MSGRPLREWLAERIYDDRGRPGDWDAGIINPSQFELDRYASAMAEARKFADEIIDKFRESGWSVH